MAVDPVHRGAGRGEAAGPSSLRRTSCNSWDRMKLPAEEEKRYGGGRDRLNLSGHICLDRSSLLSSRPPSRRQGLGGDRRGVGGGTGQRAGRGRGWGTGQRVGQGDRLDWLLPWKGGGEGGGGGGGGGGGPGEGGGGGEGREGGRPGGGGGESGGHEPAPLKEDTLRRVRLSQE